MVVQRAKFEFENLPVIGSIDDLPLLKSSPFKGRGGHVCPLTERVYAVEIARIVQKPLNVGTHSPTNDIEEVAYVFGRGLGIPGASKVVPQVYVSNHALRDEKGLFAQEQGYAIARENILRYEAQSPVKGLRI